jgi:Fe-S cluster biosynthesis and repair protein YggX
VRAAAAAAKSKASSSRAERGISLGFSHPLAVSWIFAEILRGGIFQMADEKQQGAQTVRMVKCVKLGRELPGLDRPPWKGEIGKRVYENVSKEAWAMWVNHSKMLLNEFRLNPLDPNSLKIMEEQMEQFFFGDGAKLPEGYVPPKH